MTEEYSQIPNNSPVLFIGSGGEINDLLNQFKTSNNFEVISFDITGYVVTCSNPIKYKK